MTFHFLILLSNYELSCESNYSDCEDSEEGPIYYGFWISGWALKVVKNVTLSIARKICFIIINKNRRKLLKMLKTKQKISDKNRLASQGTPSISAAYQIDAVHCKVPNCK